MKSSNTILDKARSLIGRVMKAGADEADAYVEEMSNLTISVNEGYVEQLEQATSKGLGLRVIKNGKMASSHTSDFADASLENLLQETMSLVKYTDSDECHHLPDAKLCGRISDDLDLFDPSLAGMSVEAKIDRAREVENAARDADPRVTKFRSTRYADGRGSAHLITSHGLELSSEETYAYLVTIPVAEADGEKRMGHWFTVARHLNDMLKPADVGRIATERACAQLGAKPMKGGTFPVVFDQMTAASILGWLTGAISGSLVYRRGTFLLDKLGSRIASPLVTIVEDATIPRGLGSAYFDGEGIRPWRKEIVSNGILNTYLFDTYYACKTGNTPTANAQRSYSSPPHISTFNLYLEKGTSAPEDIISSVDQGLYVTGLMGSGLDMPTGHFSVGVKGFWIENGKRTVPVSEMTMAGNVLDLLQGIEAVGTDLEPLNSTYAPTILVSNLALSGAGS